MEKMITLAIIDQQWKEHLRDMDDLKQSVQNAVYEQKDPLLIYKFEGFEAFKRFIAHVNEETTSFLMKADIPVQEPDQVQEARASRARVRLNEQKEESKSLLQGGGAPPRGGFGGPGGGGPAGGGFGGAGNGRYNLTFSLNFQNILNHVNFANPVGNLGSGFFGQSTASSGFGGFGEGAAAYNRRIDAQIRFSF